MKLLNGNILCVQIDKEVEQVGRVLVGTANNSFKRLEVVNACENAIEKGKEVYVPANCNNTVKIDDVDYIIVNLREIILIKE